MKISPNLYGNEWVEILMFSLVSRKFLAMLNIALYSVYHQLESVLISGSFENKVQL